MPPVAVPEFLGTLAAMLGVAKLGGFLARRVGQPAVLGELLGGVLIGPSLLGVVDPGREVYHLLAEVGVVLLLFAIGLETDIRGLARVGGEAAVVALAGVAVPFVLGYGTCRALGLEPLPSIVAGAALTATSVGVTARVLSDLGRLGDAEGRIILGAAILDDILGLILLTVVAGLADGRAVTPGGVAATASLAFGFLLATLAAGRLVVPPLFRALNRIDLPGTPTALAVTAAFGLCWLADRAGSAVIIGAFAAGVLLAKAPQAREIEHGATGLGHVFVPLFFVTVGAGVDVRALNPMDAPGRAALAIGGLLIVAAVAGKFVAGYAPFWFRGRKAVIGVGMIPRGEVGLIFAGMGDRLGLFDDGLFGAVTLMVLATTVVAPPLLKRLLHGTGGAKPGSIEGIEDLVTVS